MAADLGLEQTVAGIRHRVIVHHNPIGTYQRGIWVQLEKLLGSLGAYTAIVFVSEKGLNQVADWPSAYRRRGRTILNGIALPQIEPRDRAVVRAECGVASDELFVLSAGSLEQQKNQTVLVEALPRCAGARLVVAGEGPLQGELERQAADLDVGVTFLGKVPRSRLTELYRTADILAFPSLHEGRPLTLLEAASCGIGVLASDIPENRSTLGDAARYLDPTDADQWAAAFRELIDDPEALAALRSRVESATVTSVDDMVDQYLQLL